MSIFQAKCIVLVYLDVVVLVLVLVFACGPKTAHAFSMTGVGWGGVGWAKMLPSCEHLHIFDATLLRSSLDFHTSLMPRF